MATITLQYDGRNKTAKCVIQLLLNMDIFKVKQSQYDPEFVAKIRKGETEKTHAVNLKELWD
ncbi:MAG: hypothetical protein J6S82_09465 [Bacteroidales bacterium]|nr:hypothetical protein [Bacteroidales bacterium]